MTQGVGGSPRQRPSTRAVALWLGSLVAVTALWVAGLLVPYYVNDLDRLPLDEVAGGAYDPKGLWPYANGHPAAGLLRGTTVLLALPLLPLLGLGSTVAAAVIVFRQWAALRRWTRVLLLGVLALALAMTVLSLSPLGRALEVWSLD